ncbi:MAG TPA: hypothetical protein VGK74_15380 [Symbiobacteriaceae bacterium]
MRITCGEELVAFVAQELGCSVRHHPYIDSIVETEYALNGKPLRVQMNSAFMLYHNPWVRFSFGPYDYLYWHQQTREIKIAQFAENALWKCDVRFKTVAEVAEAIARVKAFIMAQAN